MRGGGWHVARAVLQRTIIHTYKNPAIIVPSLAFPLVFLLAFAGGLSAVSNVPGFEFAAGYTAFQFVFVFLQMAAFGGIFTGYRLAEDYESGFARRLMLGAPRRIGIVVGYVLATAVNGSRRDTVAGTMPRTMLRYAIEKLGPRERARWRSSPRR